MTYRPRKALAWVCCVDAFRYPRLDRETQTFDGKNILTHYFFDRFIHVYAVDRNTIALRQLSGPDLLEGVKRYLE